MCKISMEFDHLVVSKWAEFSGDYNPIHFNLEHANLLGAEALVVHGMLTMLPVKAAIYSLATIYEGWHKFRISLRFPVPQLARIDVNIAQVNDGSISKYSGVLAGEDVKLFHGTYKQSHSPIENLIGLPSVIKRDNILPGYIEKYIEHFGNYASSCIAVDSIVFADFMSTQCELVKKLVEQRVQHVFGRFKGDELTVHMSHEVVFDGCYFSNLELGELRTLNLSYQILEFNLIPRLNEIVCILDLPVFIENKLVMRVELGLLLKRKISVMGSKKASISGDAFYDNDELVVK